MIFQHKTTLVFITAISSLVVTEAHAQDTLTFGTDLELEVDNENSTITVTPSLEYNSASGFYVGADLSNEDSDEDDYSVSAYVGYAGEIGIISYDLYYGRYYLDETGDDGEEAILEVGYPTFGGLTMATALISDLDGTESILQSAAYPLPSGYEISGGYEFFETEDTDSWDIGLSKTLTDEVSLDWRYYDAEDESASIGMTVSFAKDVADWFDG